MKTILQNPFHKFKWYFICFFIFAQNTCIPIAKEKKRFIGYVPSIVALILLFYTEYTLTSRRFSRAEFSGMILHTIMLLNMMPSVSAVVESFRMPKATRLLLKTYSAIIIYVEKQMQSKPNWAKFHADVWRKSKIIIGFYLVTVTFRSWFRSPSYGRLYEFSSAIMWFYRIMAVIHLVFFIDLLSLQISTISFAVRAHAKAIRMQVALKSLKELIHILGHVKFLHFKVYQCGQILNKNFGWILTFVAIDSAFTMTITCYWTFENLMVHDNLLQIMRKYYFD